MSFIQNYHFLRPWWLMIVPVVFLFVYFYEKHSELKDFKKYIRPHLLKHLLYDGGVSKYLNTFYIMVYSVLCLTIFIAGPSYKKVNTPFNIDQSKVMIAFNLSDSMNQNDVLPSRIERSKIKVLNFLKKNKTSKIALSVFGEKSFNLLPLTTDRKILGPYVDAISVEIMSRPGRRASSLEKLIPNFFSKEGAGQYLLLISDGVEMDDIKKFEILRDKYHLNIVVYGVGLNTSDGRTLKKNKDSLVKLAQASRGDYVENTSDEDDLEDILELIQPYYPVSENENIPWEELGYYLSFLLIIPFLFISRKGVLITLVFISLFSVSSESHAFSFLDPFLSKDQQATILFKFKKYEKAAVLFENKRMKAISFYLVEDFKSAELIFSTMEDKESRFSYANSLAHQGFYLSAQEVYQELLSDYPDDERFKKNLNLMIKLVEEIDQLGKSQVSESESQNLKRKRDRHKVSRGSAKESIFKESKKSALDEHNLDVWYKQIDSNLGDFLYQKIRILDEKNN